MSEPPKEVIRSMHHRCLSFITNASGTLVNILFDTPRDPNKVDVSVQTDGDWEPSDWSSDESNEIESPSDNKSNIGINKNTVKRGEDDQNPNEENPFFVCKFCEEVLDSAEQLKNHKKEFHKASYKCNLCTKKFVKASELRLHKRLKHKKNESVQCYCCEEVFLNTISLLKHQKNHEKCEACEKLFLNKEALESHKCDPKKEFKCRVCQRLFRSKLILETHFKKIHQKKIICKICKKYYKGEKNLALHLKNRHNTSLSDYKLADKKNDSSDSYT